MSAATDHLAEIEALAVELARLAGREIEASLGRTLDVRYKQLGESEEALFRDPVSQVDHAVEVLLRARLADKFPDHGIIGEEIDTLPAARSEFTWLVDPVDGTANFINGFPLFAASIGVVRGGRPVVGAVWCSTSHALRAGVYHARQGGVLHFEAEPIPVVDRSGVRRRIVGLPRPGQGAAPGYEARQTGSASIECAFVAAGLLSGARFDAPNIWDVAGGIALVQASGGSVLTRPAGRDSGWEAFTTFEGGDPASGRSGLWRQPLILGDNAAAAALAAADA